MPIPGYSDYKKREFCNDVNCSVQLDLNKQKPDSKEYEKIRSICQKACKFTTYEFHHWLIDKGYLIVRPEKGTETVSGPSKNDLVFRMR